MYLYVTTVRPGQASPSKVMEWALAMTQKINQISEVPTSLWTSAMSPGMGSLAWTATVEDLSVIEATESKLAADPAYQSLTDQAASLLAAGSTDQNLIQIVHSDPDAQTYEAQYATVVRATLAPGAMVTGIQLGVELAQQVRKITGTPMSFGIETTGTYGGVVWIGLASDIATLQAGTEAINSNIDFAQKIDQEAAKAFIPGTQTVSRRIV